MMKRLGCHRLLLSLVFLMLTVASTTWIAYAYFVADNEYGIVLQTGEFEVIAYIRFDDLVIDLNSPYYDAVNKKIMIDAHDVDSINYIEKLNVEFQVTTKTAARVRIMIKDEWELTRTYLDQNPLYPIEPIVETIYHTTKDTTYLPFSLLKKSASFDPLYDQQGYMYFKDVLLNNQTITIPVIESGDRYIVRSNSIYMETCVVYLGIIVDVVQANRYEEFWGIDPLFFE